MSEDVRSALRSQAAALLAYFERRVEVREDAADLLGETMLQVWRRRDALPGCEVEQRMWMFTVARHVLANHRRSARRRTALAARLRSRVRAGAVADPADASAVRDAVQRLPESQRELVMLVHWDGFTVAEAAAVLGLNASTARGRYAAARDGLRQALDEPAHLA